MPRVTVTVAVTLSGWRPFLIVHEWYLKLICPLVKFAVFRTLFTQM